MLEQFLPVDASTHGFEVDALITWLHYLMLILFVGWGAFYFYTLVRFRASKNPRADYTGVKSHLSSYIEAGVAVVEVVLLIAFSIPIYTNAMEGMPSADKALTVRVVAQQYAWQIHYPGKDGKFGRTKAELVDESTNPIGLDKTDPNSADDFYTTNQLHIPTGKPVITRITSKDVIHSFGLPNFRVKQDAIPGMEVATWFEAKKTGTYNIACSQLCGNSHYRMRGYVQSMDPTKYAEWEGQQTPLFSGSEDGGDDGGFWD